MATPLMKQELEIKNLTTLDFSIDPVCKLFFHEDRIYRAINEAYEAQVRQMFDSGMMRELTEQQLFVNTWISDTRIEGFNLVLEHEKIEFWNYPYEWSFTMLKDAARVVLDVNKIAIKYGFELFDVHAYNMVFDMSTPKYIDFGSFFPIDEKNGKGWSGYLHFYNGFYMPLYLFTKGFSDLSESIFLFYGYFNEKDFFLLRNKYLRLLGMGITNQVFNLYYKSRRLANARHFKVVDKFGSHKYSKYILGFKKNMQGKYSLKRGYRLINGLKSSNFDSYWKDYHNEIDPKTDHRFLTIANLIKTKFTDANSLIELASNQGKFANFVLENSQIQKVIATDYDKNAVDTMYKNYKDKNTILPLVYDFVRPNGRRVDKNIETRIKADVVMALAVTHHLVLTQEIPLRSIFKVMEQLTNKYVIVEFMPLGLYSGEENSTPNLPEFYTLEWFKEEFSNTFEYIYDEKTEVNRHVFIGKIKATP